MVAGFRTQRDPPKPVAKPLLKLEGSTAPVHVHSAESDPYVLY